MQSIAPTQTPSYQADTGKIKLLLWRRQRAGKRPFNVIQLAHRADCHPSTISRVINGKIRDGRWIEWLAKQFGVSVQEISNGNRN